jgi:hypothetical protein
MLRRTLTTAIQAAAVAVTLTACSTTTSFHSTWRNPDADALNLRGRKVAALVLHENEALRYAAEDALAREITAHGGAGVPAYTLLPREVVRDREKVRVQLEKAQVEGVVALRAVAWNQATSGNHGTFWGSPHYASFWGPGFWGGGLGWGADGYLRTDTILIVETLVYSLSRNKLVWACQSQTMNPSQVGPFIHELSNKIGTEMEKQGLLGDSSPVWAVGF